MENNEDIQWLKKHRQLMRRFAFNKVPRTETQTFLNKMWNEPSFARTILQDFLKTNEQKQQEFIDKLEVGEPKVMLCIADKKKGKTMFMVGFVLFHLWLRGWKIYTAYPFPILWTNEKGEIGKPNQKGFRQFNKSFVLPSEVPTDSNQKTIKYYDEIAIEYPARESMSQGAVQLTSDLNTNAHEGKTMSGSTQDLRYVDKNYVANSKIRIHKYFDLRSIETREGFFTPLIEFLMPKKDEITKVLVNYEGDLSTFEFQPNEFTKEVSHYMGDVKKLGEEVANKLLKYYELKKNKKICKTKYSIEPEQSFWDRKDFETKRTKVLLKQQIKQEIK